MPPTPTSSVYLVPAFTGLGAPWWDPEARGAIFGLTRASGPAEFARAALESVAYQTRDLLEAMRADWPQADGDTVLRVDGGMTANDWVLQGLADILGAPVDRPRSARPPPSAPPGSPACTPASTPARRNSAAGLGAGAPLRAADGPRHPRGQIRRLARRGQPDVVGERQIAKEPKVRSLG